MDTKEIQAELGRLKKLEAALLQQQAGMSSQDKIRALEAAQPHIDRKTPEMEALLQAGYKMSIATAKKIIKERDENPQTWPLERYEQAQAMIAAYEAGKAELQPSSTRPGAPLRRAKSTISRGEPMKSTSSTRASKKP